MSKELLKIYLNETRISCFYDRRVNEKFPGQIKKIIEFEDKNYKNQNKKFFEVLYCYVNDIFETPKCKNCGKMNMKFLQYYLGYRKYCSVKCSANSEEKKSQIEETNLTKYGHKNIAHGIFKEKIKNNKAKKWGNEVFQRTDIFKEKLKNINLEKYGVKSYTQTEEFKTKAKGTWLKKYGVDNPFKSEKVVKKSIETKRKNGVYRNVDDIKNYKQYCKSVNYYSNITFRENYNELNPQDFKRGIFEYNLDHIYPKKEGFRNNIPPKLISHKNNLQMLWWKENKQKHDKTTMTLQDFYKLIEIILTDDF